MERNSMEKRVKKLETDVSAHLTESGVIKTNLSWNTRITCAIFLALLGKVAVDYFK